jgi:hypothetical protein
LHRLKGIRSGSGTERTSGGRPRPRLTDERRARRIESPMLRQKAALSFCGKGTGQTSGTERAPFARLLFLSICVIMEKRCFSKPYLRGLYV